jgi:hemolysin activation/secretion protein
MIRNSTLEFHADRESQLKTTGLNSFRNRRLGSCPNLCILLFCLATILPSISAYGQNLPTLDFTGRSGEKRPELLEQSPAVPSVTLPAPPAPAKESAGSLVKSVVVRKIVVTGSTVFSQEEISKITAPYENRNLTMEDLELLRRALTLLYVNKGYINSGAVIPDQKVVDGVITLRIIEGKLTSITVEGNKWYHESFLRNRIALGAGVPVNILPLQDRLQLLQQDQRIERMHAELRPGASPGESELTVRVEEKPPFYLWVAFDNYEPPSVGAEREMVTLAHRNLTGHGDILSFTYGRSNGLNPLIDAWYAVPITAHDTTLLFRYRKNDTNVVDAVFGPLDILSKSDSFELTLRQPVYRTLTQEFALSLTAEYEYDKTSLLGEPYSFYPGMDNGKSKVVPLRFAQEWTYRTQRQVFAARSRFSLGLDAFDATIHGDNDLPDGQFFAWLGQLQWARVLDFRDIQLLARADVQLTSDALLPVEQVGIGGRYTVRGYRENLLVRDKAFIASLESRVPIIQNKRWADYLQLCLFGDYGRGTNVKVATSGPKEISSVGVGLRWAASPMKSAFKLRPEAEIYYGYGLRHVDVQNKNLQDRGVHFQIAITGYF